MADILFTREPGRDLYSGPAEGTAAAQRARYLLLRPNREAPDSLSFEATWSDPAYGGYYLFLDAAVSPEQEVELARNIRSARLPGGTRLVWVADAADPLSRWSRPWRGRTGA